MSFTQSVLIEVRNTKNKGRGVFARRLIPEGTVFERVPLLVMPTNEIMDGEQRKVLEGYIFEYKKKVALALGYGSLYNHSYTPNSRYDDTGRCTKEFRALRDIHPGEEITINYNGAEDSMDPVEFPVQD
jgi:SET domain-containing protein